jgi:hypothetical protein
MIGRIYKLEGGEKFYIGSTTCELKYRLKKHKSKSNEHVSKNRLVYLHFKELGWENVTITLIKEIEVVNRNELLIYEKEEIIKVINDSNCLNSNMPFLTSDEKKKRNSDYSKYRRQANPEKERERLQKWRKENPEKRRQQTIRERYNKKDS